MILVTGASRGLGRAVAESLSAGGREVIGVARAEVDAPFPMRACDVADAQSVADLARQLRRERVRLDGVVNAAGIASMNLAVLTPPDVARAIIETNLLGTIHCCQVMAPLMMRLRAGRIVNFSTIAVALGLEGEAIYVAAKAGVEGFTRAFAREVSSFGVTVNCVAPGPVDTDLIKGVPEDKIAALVERQVIRRKMSPKDVVDVVEMLLDPRSDSVSGAVIPVGGA